MTGVGLDEGTALGLKSRTFTALEFPYTLQLILSSLKATTALTSVTVGKFYLVLNFTEMGSHRISTLGSGFSCSSHGGKEQVFEPFHGYVIFLGTIFHFYIVVKYT